MPVGGFELLLHRAARVVDGADVDDSPGAVLVRGCEVIAAGPPERIGRPADARVVEHPDRIVIPALGNAHAHLDLTAIEPAPFDGDFARWLGRIRGFRIASAQTGAHESLELGARLSIAGGVAIVGDIVGQPLGKGDLRILHDAGLDGVGFIEVFGAGRRERTTLDAIDRLVDTLSKGGVGSDQGSPFTLRVGLQPHAPYSTTARVLERALASGFPVSTHLAESVEEVEFCLRGSGPLRELLEEAGAVDPEAKALGIHPVDWLCDALLAVPRRCRPTLAVHLNEVEPRHFARLAEGGVVAVYCPRATAYFGRRGMPWRGLLRAGVAVALGTDGRLCLDTPERISTLDEMRWLAQRDGATLEELIPLATVAVARALGADAGPFTLAPGPKPGLLLVPCGHDPAHGALQRHDPPEWLFRNHPSEP